MHRHDRLNEGETQTDATERIESCFDPIEWFKQLWNYLRRHNRTAVGGLDEGTVLGMTGGEVDPAASTLWPTKLSTRFATSRSSNTMSPRIFAGSR